MRRLCLFLHAEGGGYEVGAVSAPVLEQLSLEERLQVGGQFCGQAAQLSVQAFI